MLVACQQMPAAKVNSLLQQGQLQQAQSYLKNSKVNQKLYQQLVDLERAQTLFNQGQYQDAYELATKVANNSEQSAVKKRAMTIVQLAQQTDLTLFTQRPELSSLFTEAQPIAAGIVIDQASGQILWQKNASQVLPVASMSKLLAVYTIYETISQRHLPLDTQIVAPELLANLEAQTDLTSAHLQINHRYSLQDLLAASMIASANDAIMAIGQTLYGSQPAFVQEMEATAKKLHLHGYQIVNANGLPISIDDSVNNNPQSTATENQFSARDVAIIAQNLLQKYPQVLLFARQNSLNLDGQILTNTNELLPQQIYAPNNYQVDGLKTGTGVQAGSCMTATAKLHGRRVIAIVLAAPSNDDRFLQTRSLLDMCQNNLQVITTASNQKIWVNLQNPHAEMAYQLDILAGQEKIQHQVVVDNQKLSFILQD